MRWEKDAPWNVQRLPWSFGEGTGAICSVGGRFTAWQQRVEERKMDARVEAARATGFGGGESWWVGDRFATKCSFRIAANSENMQRQVLSAFWQEAQRAFWPKSRRVSRSCSLETYLRHTRLHASTTSDRQDAQSQGLRLGRPPQPLMLPIRRLAPPPPTVSGYLPTKARAVIALRLAYRRVQRHRIPFGGQGVPCCVL